VNILGLNAYHGDASACLVRDGVIIAAAEEERFRRIKHWAGFPSQTIAYCLREGGLSLDDIDHVAVNSDPKANFWKKVGYTLTKRPDPRLVLSRLRNQGKRQSIESEFLEAFPHSHFRGRVHRIEHHLSHLASCFLVSPFEEAVTVSIDGFGDFSSAAWGVGKGIDIRVDGRVMFPHSLGIFYQALTQYLGFPHYGDEYKVMGLAPYGAPTHLEQMRRIVLLQGDGSFRLDTRYFRHHRENVSYEWQGGSPSVGRLFSPALEELLGPMRNDDEKLAQEHMNIARSVQAMYEEAFFHLLDNLHTRYQLDSLTIAGGCGMNSVANGKVLRNSRFKKLYVQSAAGDAGGAIGAAMTVWHQIAGPQRVERAVASSPLAGDTVLSHTTMEHAYLGPHYDETAISTLLHERRDAIAAENCVMARCVNESEVTRRTAHAIADGKVVGWFQGRLEWGPRALGNRSIVCDPRRADMKNILNLKIKRRESFRPFAPSIMKEYVREWFEEDADVPFMMQVFQINEDKRVHIPAVTHVDGSGRLQTVHKETNSRYWNLIDDFRKLTGVPMVLNTSFNENEPVVCQPSEALDCFLRTKMDVLVLGDWFVERLT
jgi:carbamoyltransferase